MLGSKIEISQRSVVKSIITATITTLIIYSIYLSLSVLSLVFLSLFFSFAIYKFVDFFNKRAKLPLAISILVVYIIIIILLLILVFSILPIFVSQTAILINIAIEKINYLKDFLNNPENGNFIQNQLIMLNKYIDIESSLSGLESSIKDIGQFLINNMKDILGSGLGVVRGVGTSIFDTVMIFLFSFFMLLERESITDYFKSFLDKKQENYFEEKTKGIYRIIGEWFIGMSKLAFLMATFTFIGLWLLEIFGISITHKFHLAVIAGFMEFLPVVGPILALLPAFIIAINIGTGAIVGVIILYIILQQIEGNFLVPTVMKKAIGIPSLLVIIIMPIGGLLAGIVGMIISIPLATIVGLFLADYKNKKK